MVQLLSYADAANAYWTGYFTSRPSFKGYVRVMSGYYLVRHTLPLVTFHGLRVFMSSLDRFIVFQLYSLVFCLLTGSKAVGISYRKEWLCIWYRNIS